jgi:Flp pilus assembly protein TadG
VKRQCQRRRKGAIAPLTAILLIPLMAMLAFSIDVGWITHTHNELQAAADSAALAGAGQLSDNFVRYNLPGLTDSQKSTILADTKTKAVAWAKKYASYNGAGDASSLTLLDADVELGITDTAGNYTPLSSSSGYPNTVKVLLRRDNSANNPLPTFFARVLGVSSVDLSATASASLMSGQVDSFQPTDLRSRILPMTYDVNHWNAFLQTGRDPDGSKSLTASGEPQLNIYPSIKFTGNFGELSLDQGNDGASVIRDWIANGVTSQDLRANYATGLLPLSQHDPNSFPDWKGNPGLKTSTIQEVGDNVGGLYLMPLFKPVNSGSGNYAAGNGQGSNYFYTIVAFVGVKITAVDSTGNDKAIMVQPTALIDPTALYKNAMPAQAPTPTTPLRTTFLGAKLVR